jgi:transcriptional regulator with XRE-family HTH domain
VSDIRLKIKAVREFLGIKKQSVFADKLGINRTTLVGYENGTSPPSVDFLIRLRKIYNVNIEWLLMENGSMFLAQAETDSPVGNGLTINQAQYSGMGNIQQLTMAPSGETPETLPVVPSPEEVSQPDQQVRAMTVFKIPLLSKEQALRLDLGKEIPCPNAYSGEYPDCTLVPIPLRLREYGTDLRAIVVFNSLMSPLLNPGDVAVFQVTSWSGDGVYLYRMKGDLYMSHVKASGTAYRLTKEFRAEEDIPYDEDSFETIGRVRAVVREIP